MRRWLWMLVPILVVLAVGWVWIANAQFHYIAPNILAPNDPIGARQADAQQRVYALASRAPALSNANFGSGTRSVFYRARWQVHDGFERADGMLLVILLEPGEVPVQDRYALATLWAGRLQNIPLPNVVGGISYLEFAPSTMPQRVVVDAQAADGRYYRFLVSQNRVTQLPYVQESGSFSDNYRLSSGADCQDNDNPLSSPYAMYAITPSGQRIPLVSYRTISDATGGLLQNTSYSGLNLTCHHLGRQDLIEIATTTTGVIYRLVAGRLTVITRGQVRASGQHHILISQPVLTPNTNSSYVEYLEVFAR